MYFIENIRIDIICPKCCHKSCEAVEWLAEKKRFACHDCGALIEISEDAIIDIRDSLNKVSLKITELNKNALKVKY